MPFQDTYQNVGAMHLSTSLSKEINLTKTNALEKFIITVITLNKLL